MSLIILIFCIADSGILTNTYHELYTLLRSVENIEYGNYSTYCIR